MKVLVTGSHGYIGSVLCDELMRNGAEVIGLDTNLYPSKEFLPWTGPAKFLEIDIRDIEPRNLDDVDVVVHLAALSNDPLGELDPSLTSDINHTASIRLASLCRDRKIRRFIFSSSCSIYGASEDSAVLDETAPFAPVSAYARSKADTEHELLGLATKDFAPIILRNATAYGVSPKMRFDLVLNNLFAWGFTTGHIRIDSDGTPWRPLVHIRDICQAIVLSLEAPEEVIRSQFFNVGDDQENYRVHDIGRIVQRTLPEAKLQVTGIAGSDSRSYRVNFQKLHIVLPTFRKQWTAQRGAEELLEVLKRRGLTFEEFSSGAYANVEILRRSLTSGELASDLRPNPSFLRTKEVNHD